MRPGMLSLREACLLDLAAIEAADGYEPLLLSPVAPLGASSVLAPTSQDRVLTTTRTTEVVSDPTNVLALEATARLADRPHEDVRLCTSLQTLRMQPHGTAAGLSQHFRLFAMVDAGLGRGADAFEAEAFARQVAACDALLDALERRGCRFDDRAALVQSAPAQDVLADRVAAAIAHRLPHLAVERGPMEPGGYYDGLRLSFGAPVAGDMRWVVDGGRFDWVARLTASRRYRFVATGVGLQLLPALFARP